MRRTTRRSKAYRRKGKQPRDRYSEQVRPTHPLVRLRLAVDRLVEIDGALARYPRPETREFLLAEMAGFLKVAETAVDDLSSLAARGYLSSLSD